MSDKAPARRPLVLKKKRGLIGGLPQGGTSEHEAAKKLGLSIEEYKKRQELVNRTKNKKHNNSVDSNLVDVVKTEKKRGNQTGGTKIYCPTCKVEQVCKAISATRFGEKKEQRVSNQYYNDIKWFRRGRQCLICKNQFLTGELDEKLIEELVMLRAAWLTKVKGKTLSVARLAKRKSRRESIVLEDAQNLIRACAKWDHPTAMYPVDAPKHAKRLYKGRMGWAIDFGANSFLPGYAIERGGKYIEDIFNQVNQGQLFFQEDVYNAVEAVVCGCVFNTNGDLIEYPNDSGYLTFGTQWIDIDDAVLFILEFYNANSVLLSRSAER